EHVPAPLELFDNRWGVALALRALEGKRLLTPNLNSQRTLAGRLLMRRFFRATFELSRGLASATENGSSLRAGSLTDTIDRFLFAFPLAGDERRKFEDFRA